MNKEVQGLSAALPHSCEVGTRPTSQVQDTRGGQTGRTKKYPELLYTWTASDFSWVLCKRVVNTAIPLPCPQVGPHGSEEHKCCLLPLPLGLFHTLPEQSLTCSLSAWSRREGNEGLPSSLLVISVPSNPGKGVKRPEVTESPGEDLGAQLWA